MKKFLLIPSILLLVGCSFSSEKWLGFYYPDGCLWCSENYIYSPEFDTKDGCFNWAENLKHSRDNPSDLYECGKNCEMKYTGMYVCEETVD